MKKKKNIILAVSALVLILILGLVLLTGPEEEKEATPQTSQSQDYSEEYAEKGNMFECDYNSIDKITVKNPTESFSFKKDSDNWICPDITGGVFNSAKAMVLATKLSSVKYVDILNETETAEALGFNDSTLSITFNSNKGEVTFWVMDSFTDDALSYVHTSDSERIYVVKKDVTDLFFLPLEDYRNDTLAKIDFKSATDIVLCNGESEIVLKKGTKDTANAVFDEWKMLKPLAITASDSMINEKILTAMEEAKIAQFCSESGDFDAYGLGEKNRYLKVTNDSGKTMTLFFSEKTNGSYYVCTDSDSAIYRVAEGTLPFVDAPAIDFADRHIKLVMKTSLSKILIEGEGNKYTVEVSQNRDESKVNSVKLSETEFTQNVFTPVCGMIADDIFTEASGDVRVKVKYTYLDSKTDTIEFLEHNERYYVVSLNSKPMFLVLKTKVEAMLSGLEQYK